MVSSFFYVCLAVGKCTQFMKENIIPLCFFRQYFNVFTVRLSVNAKKRKKPSPSPSDTTATASGATTSVASGGSKEKKKRDLEVRKDLTLPTAPTAGVDNVFQVKLCSMC